MAKLGNKAKINRLNDAFMYWFAKYESVAEWWGTDDDLLWLFNIPTDDANNGTYKMTTDDNGTVKLYRKPYCKTLLHACADEGYRFCGSWEK